jgi:hypothetical protein
MRKGKQRVAMGKSYEGIDPRLRAFIERQHMFFVATAPLGAAGHVNLSPKGLDALRVLAPTRVAYADYVGSGAETIAHVRQNGRITLMFCAFEGAPKIVRLYGAGEVLEPDESQFADLRPLFPDQPVPRAIIVVALRRVAESCGFGVPLYRFERQRSQLPDWAARRGTAGLRDYQLTKNATSIDDIPAVTWLRTGSGERDTG